MSCRTGLVFFCLFLIIIPANALCHWSPEGTRPPGVPPCSGYQDSHQQHWPRLPTDTEITTAKEEYLSYLLYKQDDSQRRIDSVQIAKFHTCEGTWVNNVDMEVKYSWWEESKGEWQSWVDYTFLIYDPGRNHFEFVLTHIPSPYFLGFYTNAVQGFATGSCSQEGGAVPPTVSGGSLPPEPDDNSWIVIIGAIAVIGGGLAIGAKKLAGGKGEKTSGEKKKKEKEPEKVRYILQLSSDRLTVTPDSTGHLKVTAWKIVGESPLAPAPEAALTLTVPAGNDALSVRPNSGTGSVDAIVALVDQVAKSPVPITVTAAAGKSSVSSQVMVEIPHEYLMEFF